MKKILPLIVLMLLVCSAYAQKKPIKVSDARYDYNVTDLQGNLNIKFAPTIHNPYAPSGNVPFPINYNDYGTNGNAMKKILVLGDTIIIGADINPQDGAPPPSVTPARVYYQFSYNGGTTWQTSAISTSAGTTTRWPNMFPIINGGLRSLAFSGRVYGAAQGSLAMVETILGLGSVTLYTAPLMGRDYFADYKNSTMIGGISTAPTAVQALGDSIVYRDFNYVTGTWGNKALLSSGTEASARWMGAIANNGQNITGIWWKSANGQAMNVHESVNGGTSFGAGVVVCPLGSIFNGDTVCSWFGMDVAYKPNSTIRGMAVSTLGVISGAGSYGTREGAKLLYWSPTINGGVPVVVMDRFKYAFMNDENAFNNNPTLTQVGVTFLSHPSIGWSDDGTVLYCVMSAIQPDTANYTPTFNYNNIFVCKSTDDGATWSNAYYVTNTARRDETYPSIAKKGNSSTFFHVTYMESGSPGCYTFNDNAPIDTTYTVYKKLTLASLTPVPVGVKNISTEVPDNYSLMQNYPNPFNPTTTIRFSIPKDSRVTIKVYDIMGRVVATVLDNERVTVGVNEVSFGASGLSSGIYFYTMQAGDFKETKKMMLVK